MGVTVISSSPVAPQTAPADIAGINATDGGGLDFAALLGQQIISLAGSNISGKTDLAPPENSAPIQDKDDDKEALSSLPGSELPPMGIFLSPPLDPKAAGTSQVANNLDTTNQSISCEVKTTSPSPKDASTLMNGSANTSTKAETSAPLALTTPLSISGATNAKNDAPAILAVETTPGTEQTSFSTLLNTQTGNQLSAAAPKEQPAPITTPLPDRQWPQSFGERIVWMAKNEQQVAQININPPQLGPVQITLNLSGDQATAVFASPHAEVRQAIQDAMPQLREMLSSAGVSLGQTNVGAQTPQQNREAPEQFANGARFSGETAILSPDGNSGSATSGKVIQRGRGLVDLFA